MAKPPVQALTEVTTEELKRLLKSVHQDTVRCPLNVAELTRIGLQYRASDILAVLRGLDAAAVRAVMVAVLAERLKTAPLTVVAD